MITLSDTAALKEKDQRHHVHTSTNPVQFAKDGPTMITKAEGIYFYTDDGQKILDAGSGLSNVNIGYGNKRICDVAYKTMQQLSFSPISGGRTNPWAAALSDKLNSLTPDNFQHFFFASGGSDAMESAIKMAWKYWRLRDQPNKRALIAREGSYHGNTIMTVSLSGLDIFKDQFGLPLTDLVHQVDSPYWYRDGQEQSEQAFGLKAAASLEQKILEIGAENVAAFVAEPIVAAADTIIPPDSYWPEIRRICDQYDVLLIADEIITGFGKTGQWFGFQNFDYEPDMFVMAKGLSSGYFPISSVAIGEKVSDLLQNTDELFAHIFTNCGHPVGAAVALENIAVIEEQRLVEKVRDDIGPYLAERLQEFLVFPCVGAVRSLGVLGAIEIDISKMSECSFSDNSVIHEKVSALAWDKGVTMRASGLVLPMIITRAQVDDVIDTLKASFTEVLADVG